VADLMVPTGRNGHALSVPRTPRTRKPSLGGALAYLLLALFNGLPWFLVLLVLTVAGLGLSVVWIGIPILMLTTTGWRGAARMERRWIRRSLRTEIANPYRPLREGSVFRRWRGKMVEPATWRDFSYLVLRLPLCIAEFALTIALWSYSLFFIALPIIVAFLPTDSGFSVPFMHHAGSATESDTLPYAIVGLAGLLLAIVATPRLAQFQAWVASLLLGPTRASELVAKAEHLQASRARGVDAAEAERRRIERDLHDGAQQRLIALAMTLGRAKNKLDTDPDALRELLDEAHTDAKLAVAELRDLARGIYPAVLGDRGLDAALSALAQRCAVPVDVLVEVDPRPPTAVESTAYFIVAEALTNVSKHARAEHARIWLRRTGEQVLLTVADDGQGGAELRAGGGLAGLADRAATIDGVLTVSSPSGGPTVLHAELPCVW
jgi:signal transduction histidine kinase